MKEKRCGWWAKKQTADNHNVVKGRTLFMLFSLDHLLFGLKGHAWRNQGKPLLQKHQEVKNPQAPTDFRRVLLTACNIPARFCQQSSSSAACRPAPHDSNVEKLSHDVAQPLPIVNHVAWLCQPEDYACRLI